MTGEAVVGLASGRGDPPTLGDDAPAGSREPLPDPLPAIDLRPLFAPRSIAIVGASARGGIAQTVRANLAVLGSETRCHFVNPRYDELYDEPCHPSIAALPEVPDTVVVAVNPLRAAAVVQEAAEAGVPSVIIPGGGVVEGGEAAAQMQRDVREIALRHGIALLGPNCMGLVDLTTNSASYIGDVNPWLPRGGVAGIAQSGSVTDAFIHSGNRIGFSRIVGCGSEAVLDVCDFLAHAIDDDETHAIILFVEGFKRPEKLLALCDQALAMGKPVLAVKVGRSSQAGAAAIAHSGSLAGDARATEAALRAVGVILCEDLDALLETAELVAGCRRLGRRVGRGRTGVVTVSTGEASLIADLVPRTGIDLPDVPAATRAALLRDLPTLGYVGNPLDPWGATDATIGYRAAFTAFASSGAYDVLALVHDFPYRSLPSEVETALEVVRPLVDTTADRSDLLPVFVSLTAGDATPEIVAAMEAAGGIPVLRGAVAAFRAIADVARWEAIRADRVDAGRARRPVWQLLAGDRRFLGHDAAGAVAAGSPPAVALPEEESLARIRALGIPVVDGDAVGDVEAAVASAERLGFPVVLKLDVVGLAHKSEHGAVRIGLPDPAAVRRAAVDLLAVPLPEDVDRRGLSVSRQLDGVELIVGGRRDASFGPIVLVGLGGVLAEALDDVAVRLGPVSAIEARAMLSDLRGAAILDGFRGRSGIDREAVVKTIVGLSDAFESDPTLLEVDLNPVISGASGTAAVDALVVVARPGEGPA
ncbi:MAG TPA: acetate--CoA ligase family protein [Candidatus Limnocylindrales bacterium]|nr:acetate--CoA ligase family protein [Candidatus Limnocylindrales bacterium]